MHEMSQMILGDEFAMIALIQLTRNMDIQELGKSLGECCQALGVTYALRVATTSPVSLPANHQTGSQPSKDIFIVTVIGSARIDIVPSVTKVLADMNINIAKLSAATHIVYGTPQYEMIAQVEVDDCIDMPLLRSNLEDCARRLSVAINIQSLDIFNAMYNI